MSAESSDSVRAPAAGQVSGLVPASPRKRNPRGQGQPRARKGKKNAPPEQGQQEQLPAAAEDADDRHSVDYLA